MTCCLNSVSFYLQDLVIILETMRIIAIALSPIAPSLSLKIYTQLGFTEDQFRVLRWVCSIRDMLSDLIFVSLQVIYFHPLKYSLTSSENARGQKHLHLMCLHICPKRVFFAILSLGGYKMGRLKSRPGDDGAKAGFCKD